MAYFEKLPEMFYNFPIGDGEKMVVLFQQRLVLRQIQRKSKYSRM